MNHAIDAIYENGTFRPIRRDTIAIADGQRVRITVDDECEPEPLRLAMNVYEGLSDNDIEEIERIASTQVVLRHVPTASESLNVSTCG